MRNLKRVLTMIMAVAMMMSLVVVSAGATKFSDDADIVNKKAVEQMSSLNIINGRDTGSFDPKANITRAEAVKMIVVALNGGNDPKLDSTYVASSSFTDAKGHWAEGYIEYAVNFGFVQGRGGQIFEPDANVTGTELAKMCLVAIGYKSDIEKFANNAEWALNINRVAQAKNLYDGIQGINANVAINRDNAAQMIANFVKAPMVKYEFAGLTGNTNTGLASQQQAVEIIISGSAGTTAIYQTVLNKYYKLVEFVGVLKAVGYDSKKNEYGYTVDQNLTPNHTDNGVTTFWTATDYTALIGQNVNAMFCNKDNNVDANNNAIYNRGVDTVYDIIAKDSAVIAEGVMTDFGKLDVTAKTLKFKDQKYDVTLDSGAIKGIEAYSGDPRTVTDTGTDKTAQFATFADKKLPYNVKLVDNNDDGKIDFAVATPFTVQKVSYMGNDLVTFAGQGKNQVAVGNIDQKKLTAFDGIKKDDIVAFFYATNTTKAMDTAIKLETKAGKVSETRQDKTGAYEYKIDGVWYTSEITDTLRAGDAVNYIAVGTHIYYAKVTTAEPTSRRVLAVYDKVKKDTTDNYGNTIFQVKAILGEDGTKPSNITVAKVDGAEVTNLDQIVVGRMYTYVINDGDYELKSVNDANLATHDGQVGAKDPVTDISTPNNGSTGYSDKKVAGYELTDDAAVIVVDTLGKDAKKFNGADLKRFYGTGSFGLSGQILFDKVDGFHYATVAVIVAEEIPVLTTATKYGILTEDASQGAGITRIFQVLTQDGVKTLQDESTDSYKTFVKGTVISYNIKTLSTTDGTNTVIKDVKKAPIAVGAVTGVKNDLSMVQFNKDTKQYTIDKSTIVLNINGEDFSTYASHDIPYAPDASVKNAYYVANASNSLDLIIVDLNTKYDQNNSANNRPIPPQGATYATPDDVSKAADLATLFTKYDEVIVNGSYAVSEATTVPANKTLTVKGALTQTAAITQDATATINVTGDATLDQANTLEGAVNVGGKLTIEDVATTFAATSKIFAAKDSSIDFATTLLGEMTIGKKTTGGEANLSVTAAVTNTGATLTVNGELTATAAITGGTVVAKTLKDTATAGNVEATTLHLMDASTATILEALGMVVAGDKLILDQDATGNAKTAVAVADNTLALFYELAGKLAATAGNTGSKDGVAATAIGTTITSGTYVMTAGINAGNTTPTEEGVGTTHWLIQAK